MRILVVDDEEDIRDIVTDVLELDCGASSVEASSGNQAIEILQKDAGFDAIISDHKMPNGTGSDLLNFVSKNYAEIPFIFCSTFDPARQEEIKDLPVFAFVQKPDIRPGIIEAIQNLKKTNQEYVPLAFENLVPGTKNPADVFLQISAKKYVKIFRKDDPCEEEDIDRYRKKVGSLYIRQADGPLFLASATQSFMSLLDEEKPSLKEAFLASSKGIDLLHQFVKETGVTPELERFTSTLVNLTIQVAGRDLDVSQLRPHFEDDPAGFLAAHSSLLAFLSVWIAKQNGNDSGADLKTLSFAAILHDITLPTNDLARVRSIADLQLSGQNFSPEDQAEYLGHTQKSADLAAQLEHCPAAAIDVIKQHHERPDSGGFPLGVPDSRINPLSAIFIVAEDLAHFAEENGWDIKAFVKSATKEYPAGQFRRIVQVLDQRLAPPDQLKADR